MFKTTDSTDLPAQQSQGLKPLPPNQTKMSAQADLQIPVNSMILRKEIMGHSAL